MGCKPSSIVKHEGGLYNEDLVFTRKILTGLTANKNEEGISGNTQLAISSTSKKKYTQVDQVVLNEQTQVDQVVLNEQTQVDQVVLNEQTQVDQVVLNEQI